jgi:hypothetical protein
MVKYISNSLFFIFIFIFLLVSVPSLAYYDFDLNTTYSFGSDNLVVGMDCINDTSNDIYCYVQSSTEIIKFNETLQEVASCNYGTSSTPNSLTIANETTAYVSQGNDGAILNITTMSGDCSVLNSSSANDWSRILQANAFGAYRGSATTSRLYHAESHTDFGLGDSTAGYWFANITTTQHSIPDKDTNNIHYVISNPMRTCGASGQIQKYTGEVLGATYDNITAWYDVGPNDNVHFDIIEVNGTEYIFIVQDHTSVCDGSETDYLYRADWAFAEAGGSPDFYAFAPRDQQDITLLPTDTEYNLYAYLNTSADFGTLTFYHENNVVGWIFINATNRGNLIYSQSVVFNGTEGEYTWYAHWFDNDTSTLWEFGTSPITYNITTGLEEDFVITNPFEALAIQIGTWFGLDNLDYMLAMASVFFSLIAGILVLWLGRKSKWGMQGFFVVFFSLLLVFTIIGWFYTWAMAIIILVLAFIFWLTMFNK